MTITLMDRRAAFMRVGVKSDQIGRESVKPDNNTIIRYNWRESGSVYDELVKHAEENDGKVIIPFDSIVSIRSLDICSRFVYWRTDGKYLIGNLHESGENYRRGMDDRDGYTAPPALHVANTTRWVKLSDVRSGDSFPFDRWHVEAYRKRAHNATPLAESLKHSHMNLMFVYEERETENA